MFTYRLDGLATNANNGDYSIPNAFSTALLELGLNDFTNTKATMTTALEPKVDALRSLWSLFG
jgi:hypothetical protein